MATILPVRRPPSRVQASSLTPRVPPRERSALDLLNTSPRSETNKQIVSEEIGQDTFHILRLASSQLAAFFYGCCADDAERERTGRTIRGSLYFKKLWGNDDEE